MYVYIYIYIYNSIFCCVLYCMLELRTTFMLFVYNTVWFFSWRVLLKTFLNLSTYWMCYLWQHVYISSSIGIVYHCLKCNKRILSHAAVIRCLVCGTTCHEKCISNDPAGIVYIRDNSDSGYCEQCLSNIFPFNHIVEDDELRCAINSLDGISRLINSDLILNPLEINDSDYQSPLCDIDPDLCIFNEIEYQVSPTCNYFDCESFKKAH